MDLRERVARAHAESGSSAEVAEAFGCSESWVRRLTRRLREAGSLAPRSTARTDGQRAFDDADEAKIREPIQATPDATLAEVAAAVGKPACPGTVSRTLKRLELPRKKVDARRAERDRPDVVARRAAWFGRFAGRRVADLARAAGCEVMRLPPYSPDFNPIEHAIAKVKAMLRELAKRTVPELFDAVGEALASVTAADARAYIAHCGYATKRRNTL